MNDFIRFITLQDPATRSALLGGVMLGVTAGVVGCLAILRRRALLGDTLAHASLPGVCIAYMIAGGRTFTWLLGGALVSGIGAIGILAVIRSRTKMRDDAALGVVLSGFFALGIVLSSIIQRHPSGSPAGLETFLFGQAGVMTQQDLITLACVAIVALGTILLLFRPLMTLCFDQEFAQVSGLRTTILDFVLMGIICITTIVGLPAAGVVLISSLLIIPAVTARLWTHNLAFMLMLAGALGGVSAAVGVAASTLLGGVATGPAITLSAAGCLGFSLLLAPRTGVLSRAFAKWRLRRRIAMQNFLRAIFEVIESNAPAQSMPELSAHVPLQSLALKRGWSLTQLEDLASTAERMGLVQLDAQSICLTPRGQLEAVSVVRTHRLWETFLIEEASLPHDHVDRDADQIEHVLPDEIVQLLEERLRAQGRLPLSPHVVPKISDAGVHA